MFTFDGSKKYNWKEFPTKLKDVYEDSEDYEKLLAEKQRKLDELQSKMYAHNQYGLLVIFQAMDAAGKDSAIKNVFSGINPHGLEVKAFKRPSDTELDHDFLWRTNLELPERGKLVVFNRSYYEEVLVVKVHPEILANYQRIPAEYKKNPEKVWKQRYEDINALEKYLTRNGIHVMKIHLHISKKEQAERFLERLEDPAKNWKFEEADLKEREHWDAYMEAYQDAINETASKDAPWQVIPADDKKNARLFIADLLIEKLESLDISYPELDETQKANLAKYKKQLEAEL